MKYHVLLFDFDYTLVDASGCLFGAIRAGLISIGMHTSVDDSKLKPLIGIPLQDQFRILTGTTDRNLFEVYYKSYASERKLKEAPGTQLIVGVESALRELKKAKFQLGVVSTGSSSRIIRALERFGVLQFFGDGGIFGDYQQKSDGIRKATSQFHVSESQTAYIGDRPDDGDAARQAGVDFIAVATGAFKRSDFAPDSVVLDSVAQLPAYLID